MTLTALIRQEGRLISICPSLEIEQQPELEPDIIRDFRDRQKQQDYYCPHCYGSTGNLEIVRLRNPEKRIAHFYHPKTDSDRGCPNFSPESEKHKQAKIKILRDLQVAGFAESVWCEYDEEVRRISLPGIKRHPDLLAMMPNGALVVHEVQISAITPDELKQRTEDYRACPNVAQVVWYLASAPYTRENRMLLRSLTNVEYYRLYFRNKDAVFPDYAKDTEVFETKEKPTAKPVDNCSSNSRYRKRGKAEVEMKPPKLPPKVHYYPIARPVKIKTEGGFYDGLVAEAVGECDGLIAVPLPERSDRVGYTGFFKSEYLGEV